MKYYVMSVGADGRAAPDRWISDWGFTEIHESHLTNWWSPQRAVKPRIGDIAFQVSILTGSLLGIFRVTREAGQSVPHPSGPQRWRWDLGLEPLLTWDGRYAPSIVDLGYDAGPRTYMEVDAEHERAALELVRRHLPALFDELNGR